MKKKIISFIFCILCSFCTFCTYCFAETEFKNKPASTLSVINYARNLLLTVVDQEFRGSWVINPENKYKITEEKVKKNQITFEKLGNIKIGTDIREVRKFLGNPKEIRENLRIWIYGQPLNDGTYKDLTEVFLDETKEKVIGIISFNPEYIDEKFGVKIGDSIDKMLTIYNEPSDEKDFIEDPDNKDYLGLYYLYPKSGVGFLLGQNKEKNNLLVQGVLVFGKK